MARKDFSITFRMSKTMWQDLKRLSEDQGISLGRLLRKIILDFLDSRPNDRTPANR